LLKIKTTQVPDINYSPKPALHSSFSITSLASPIMQPKLSIPTLLSAISQPYTPKLVATVNSEYDVKIARTSGAFIWHAHPETDEFFYILSGTLTIQLEREGGIEDVVLEKGEMFVVPMGMRHRPMGEAEIMMIERCGVINTGDAEPSNLTKVVEDVRGD